MHDRDRQIVLTVGRFGQVTSGQLKSLLFSDLASSTPTYRALERLYERKYLARIERRMVGGTGAGSGQYVYQLGSKGWALCMREGRYWPARSVNYHSLTITDVYVSLVALERTGQIAIDGLLTEPDTWQTIDSAKLTPDMQIELTIPSSSASMSLWLEIDLGTERPRQIKEKLARYWHAYQHAAQSDLKEFPVVVFLAPDEARLKELKWIISRGNADARKLFRVSLTDEFTKLLAA